MGDEELDVLVLVLDQLDVAGVAVADEELAGGEAVLYCSLSNLAMFFFQRMTTSSALAISSSFVELSE